MAKTRHINLRIPESDFKKIEAMLHGRTITKFFKDLVKSAVEKEREETESFLNLLKKIDSSDLSKIAEKLDMVMETLEVFRTAGEGKIDMAKLMRYLQRILTESAKARIEIEEYARRNMPAMPFQLWESDVKVQFGKYKEDWKNQPGGEK